MDNAFNDSCSVHYLRGNSCSCATNLTKRPSQYRKMFLFYFRVTWCSVFKDFFFKVLWCFYINLLKKKDKKYSVWISYCRSLAILLPNFICTLTTYLRFVRFIGSVWAFKGWLFGVNRKICAVRCSGRRCLVSAAGGWLELKPQHKSLNPLFKSMCNCELKRNWALIHDSSEHKEQLLDHYEPFILCKHWCGCAVKLLSRKC